MKIVMFGDSITDMNRDRQQNACAFGYGVGYTQFIAGELISKDPEKYTVLNRGISGDRIVDLYARIKADVWNLSPDVLSILIGINDIWHEIGNKNGVEIDRYEKIYRMIIEDTLKRLPSVKMMLCEPFVLEGNATRGENYSEFLKVKDYAKIVKKLAEEYNLIFVPLQKKFDEVAAQHESKYYLYDGVHPDAAGAKLIATEWLKAFKNIS